MLGSSRSNGTDIVTPYRTCCISTSNSSSSLPVPTLFDSGASRTAFVNRHVVAWIESKRRQRPPGKRQHSFTPSALVSLAGMSLTSPIYGSEVFNLFVFHEVIRSNESLYSLHAKVVDSCIDIIVSRPVLREHHLEHKFSHASIRRRALSPT